MSTVASPTPPAARCTSSVSLAQPPPLQRIIGGHIVQAKSGGCLAGSVGQFHDASGRLHRLLGEAAAASDATRRTSNVRHVLSILPMLVLPKNLCVELLAAMITRWAWSVNSCNCRQSTRVVPSCGLQANVSRRPISGSSAFLSATYSLGSRYPSRSIRASR